MRLAQAPFLILLIAVSAVTALHDKSRLLTKTLEKIDNEESNDFITISLKKMEITSKQKHEIFDFVSKSQSYLFSNQEKNILLSTERRLRSASNSELRMQKISLYNFKNTQVNKMFSFFSHKCFSVYWRHFFGRPRKYVQCDIRHRICQFLDQLEKMQR